ncbi:ABC transporter ATP-binding protein [candidate division WOR-3 bacterium]|nr:ABC transporter ATP-binding protein [candidate division WOR-3 bacterium]
MEPVIRLEGVARDFSDGRVTRRVLKETSLDVMPGELTVLAGPSGSGKTTLLTIVGLVLKPSAGRITVAGADATGLTEDELASLRLAKFGFVFQQAALVPALSALDNVLIAGAVQGARIGDAERREAVRLLTELGMAGFLEARPQRLSGGQQQRVGIARALFGNPAVILCDEPTSALDHESSEVVLAALKRLSRDPNRGVVLVTHDPRVFPYADRLVKMEDGAVVYDSRAATGGT